MKKERLQQLKDKIISIGSSYTNVSDLMQIRLQEGLSDELIIEKHVIEAIVDIDKKIDNYISWYKQNIVKGIYTEIGEFYMPRELRDFIEKMAVWYELRYPDYEIENIYGFSSKEIRTVNETMFENNPYFRYNINPFKTPISKNILMDLDFKDFYNARSFIDSLSLEEQSLLRRVKYNSQVYLDRSTSFGHLHLTANGFVEDAEGVFIYTNKKIRDKDLIGKHIKEVIAILKENGINLSKNNELERAVKSYEYRSFAKEWLLNSVLFRIIERGGNRMGARRAYLFAKEFGRNEDYVMMYAVDTTDPELRHFVELYLEDGGNPELEVYEDYFSYTYDRARTPKVKISDLVCYKLKQQDEKKKLYQRLVNAIASSIDENELEQEEVNALRLQRKINKSNKK